MTSTKSSRMELAAAVIVTAVLSMWIITWLIVAAHVTGLILEGISG